MYVVGSDILGSMEEKVPVGSGLVVFLWSYFLGLFH